ncbi:MAG: protein kinase domain-containing protein [Ilumatobacteraceae bacterium]
MSAILPVHGGASPTILADRYRLDRRLAQGGMAEVWVGTDLALTRQVAVKLLKPTLAADPIVAERFRREAIAVAQLSHPNIVAVFDAIEDTSKGSRRQAVVMQLVSGKSLRQVLDEKRRLSPAFTMHIGKCIAAALECAHRANLVHRDVKPGNILITPQGSVLLTDFGIAKGIDDGDDLTSPNIMMGTAKYLSPEQVRGNRLDGRADLYSLGLVLYECLAGRVPFLGETDADTALARLNRDPTDLMRLRPTLPMGLAPLIHRLLAREPGDRFASGAELRAEIARLEALPPAEAPRRAGAGTDRRAKGAATPTMRSDPARPQQGRADSRRPATPQLAAADAVTAPQDAPTREPVHRSGRPAGPPRVADRTPQNPRRPEQRPNRHYEQRTGTTGLVVAVLLLLALVAGGAVWASLRQSNSAIPSTDGQTGDTSTAAAGATLPTGDTPGEASGIPTSAAPGGGPAPLASIVALTSYDPDGDGDEQPSFTALAIDGDPATAWGTLCYVDRYMGSKGRVGIVADLGTVQTATIRVGIASAPSQVRIFSSSADVVPPAFADWGSEVAQFADSEPVKVEATVTGRWVLIAFYELGPDEACTENPYRGAISEITIVS